MTDEEILERAVEMGKFIANCFSETVEVSVHDVRHDLDHSAIAIFNNHVSGRKVGAPTTAVARRFLTEKQYENEKAVMNYDGITFQGKPVRASTYFVRNAENKIIGFICTNVDVSCYEDAAKVLEDIIHFGKQKPTEIPILREDYPVSLEDSIGYIINHYASQADKRLVEFDTDDNIAIVTKMEEKGLFSLKGAISHLAEALNISEPTVYRYLKAVRKGK